MSQRDYTAQFGRVFDSIVTALGLLEVTLGTIERSSGLVTGTGFQLPPTGREELFRQWTIENGYPVALLDHPNKADALGRRDDDDILYQAMYRGWSSGVLKTCTLQVTKLEEKRTRVKATFSNVLYPSELERLYDLLWHAIDRQVFIDRSLEGESIRKRE
jgi:hypothetical protein